MRGQVSVSIPSEIGGLHREKSHPKTLVKNLQIGVLVRFEVSDLLDQSPVA